MKSESLEFQEIFGATTIMESIDSVAPVVYTKPEPHLPVIDDPFTEFSSVTGGRSADQVQDQEFIKAVAGCDLVIGSGMAQPATQAGLSLLKLVQSANARNREALTKRSGVTREEITAKMSRFYHHGLWKSWELMMQSCIGDDEFSEAKALSFLR
jgi:hypothetical protein